MRKIAIIPTYEPPNSFIEYARKLSQTADRLVVVNDGSNMCFQPVFDEIGLLPNATVISYGQNRGKGYALKQAFSYCMEHFDQEDVIVTADCDGQHSLADVAAVCNAAAQNPESYVLGVRNFDCAVIAIGEDLAASILTAMNLQELGIPFIVCKAKDETHRHVLEKLGINRVVIPEQEQAQRLARSLHSHNVLEYIELSEEYGILEVPAPKGWIGKTLKELNIRAKLGVNIIAVESDGKTNVSPAADYCIQAGDVMVVLGENYALEAVQKL